MPMALLVCRFYKANSRNTVPLLLACMLLCCVCCCYTDAYAYASVLLLVLQDWGLVLHAASAHTAHPPALLTLVLCSMWR